MMSAGSLVQTKSVGLSFQCSPRLSLATGSPTGRPVSSVRGGAAVTFPEAGGRTPTRKRAVDGGSHLLERRECANVTVMWFTATLY